MAGRRFSHQSRNLRRPVLPNSRIPSEASRGDSDLERRLKDGAEIVARECARVAAKFSRRIPGSVHVTGNLGGGIWIEAGGAAAPNAYPFDPEIPPVRHPVYARGPRSKWAWAEQPYRPFLEEGAERGAEAASEAVAKVLDDWARKHGFNK